LAELDDFDPAEDLAVESTAGFAFRLTVTFDAPGGTAPDGPSMVTFDIGALPRACIRFWSATLGNRLTHVSSSSPAMAVLQA
jgi:hypothetical protein